MMKIGIICEGGMKGADRMVYEFLAKQILPDAKIISKPLDKKTKLIQQCGQEAKALLELDGCERVIIIWDLQPAWKRKESACRYADCSLIKQSLQEAQLDKQQLKQVHLVCMEQELETLFLADEQAIEQYLAQMSRRDCKVKYFRHLESYKNAKKAVEIIFEQHSGKAHLYRDMIHAEKLIQLVTIKKLKRCPSFVRFAIKVANEHHVSRLLDMPLTNLLPPKET